MTSNDARVVGIGDAVRQAMSKKQMWPGEWCGDDDPLAWDRKMGFLFARLADRGLEAAATDEVKRIAEFHVGGTELVLPPTESLRRA